MSLRLRTLVRWLSLSTALPLVVSLAVTSGAVPAAAETALQGDVVAVDVDTGAELLPIAGRTRSIGSGYAFFAFSGGMLTQNAGTYTVRLVDTPGIEEMRAAVKASVDDVNAQHAARLTLAPGVTAARVASAGEILVAIDDTKCPTSAGCASPGVRWMEGEYHAVSGLAWITPQVLRYTADQKQHVVAHELGHTLGLAHYDQTHQGATQLMHFASYEATTLRTGDLAGLRFLSNPTLIAPSIVTGYFRDLLGRAPTAAELDVWTHDVIHRGQDAVAASLLNSAEHRTRVIVDSYRAALGRTPSGGELAQQLASLERGTTQRTLLATLWSSDEAHAGAGGTDTAWVASLHRGILGRDGDSAALAAGVSAAAVSGRFDVARSILASPEYATRHLEKQYRELLGLPVSAIGTTMWTPYVQSGDWENLTRELVITHTYEKAVLARYGV
ncbi:hypothetical protein GCM10027406_00470 [Leifsonia lichenia]